MTRHRNDPFNALTDEERGLFTQSGRSASEPGSHVGRAKALLAAADGRTYQEAAEATGRCAGDVVVHLVSRFTREDLAAIAPRHGGGVQPILYFHLTGSSVAEVVCASHLAPSNLA